MNPIRKLWWSAQWFASRRFFLDLNRDHRQTVFYAGSARSGSTWLTRNIINFDKTMRYIYEPFNSNHMELFKDVPYMQYIRPGERGHRLEDRITRVIDGRMRNPFSDAYNPRLLARRRLIKATSSNLFLGWLYERFPGMPIVLVLRHPCAVATSRMKKNWNVGMRGWLLEQPDLIEDHLDPFMDEILKAETDFQKQILVWCIQYHVVFRQFKPGEIYTGFYEDFCLEPRKHIPELFEYLNLNCPEALFESIDVPSSSSADLDLETDHPVSRWKQQLSSKDMDEALRLLNLFGLDRLYNESPRPRPNGLSDLA